MKYCSKCGQACEVHDVYCTNCGNKLDAVEENVVMNNVDYTNNYNNTEERKNMNVMCVIGFVCSFFSSILGFIFSIIGLSQIKNTGEDGKAFATAGIIISAVKLVLIIFFIILCYAIYSSVIYNSIYY